MCIALLYHIHHIHEAQDSGMNIREVILDQGYEQAVSGLHMCAPWYIHTHVCMYVCTCTTHYLVKIYRYFKITYFKKYTLFNTLYFIRWRVTLLQYALRTGYFIKLLLDMQFVILAVLLQQHSRASYTTSIFLKLPNSPVVVY